MRPPFVSPGYGNLRSQAASWLTWHHLHGRTVFVGLIFLGRISGGTGAVIVSSLSNERKNRPRPDLTERLRPYHTSVARRGRGVAATAVSNPGSSSGLTSLG